MNISVLCKVVDNFGDIGVVWRMCRQLFLDYPDLKLHLIVDDLSSFNKIWPKVDVNKDFQAVDGIDVYRWEAADFCSKKFLEKDGEKLEIILETFQCGRPDWLEDILFHKKLKRTVHIIMIDYLTAEKYAEDFHCLQSLTRSAKVQKVNFMPGFTAKTGGLIIDREWKKLEEVNIKGPALVFTYEKNWAGLCRAIKKHNLKVKLAQGRGMDSFYSEYIKISDNIEKLPFLKQDEWDKVLKGSSVLFIRGEESLSRACLSGIPFVWHAYPQSDEYQLVKVNALLERIKNYFKPEDFLIVKNIWTDFNLPLEQISEEKMEKDADSFLDKREKLIYGFRAFAEDLRKNGDLCSNLMTFIQKFNIMDI